MRKKYFLKGLFPQKKMDFSREQNGFLDFQKLPTKSESQAKCFCCISCISLQHENFLQIQFCLNPIGQINVVLQARELVKLFEIFSFYMLIRKTLNIYQWREIKTVTTKNPCYSRRFWMKLLTHGAVFQTILLLFGEMSFSFESEGRAGAMDVINY